MTTRKPLHTISLNKPKENGSTNGPKSTMTKTSTTTASSSRFIKPTSRLNVIKKTTTHVSVPPTASLTSLIQQDKARSKQKQAAHRLPIGLLATPSLAAALATKTIHDPAWSEKQERIFVEWMNCQLVGNANGSSLHSEPIIPDALYARHRASTLQLYHSPATHTLFTKMDAEIDSAHITLKLSSSEIGEDYGQRVALLELFFHSFTNYWLKLLTETISGFEVPKSPETGSSFDKDMIHKFVEEFLFEDESNQILPNAASSSETAIFDQQSFGSDAETRSRVELARKQLKTKKTLKKVFRLLFLADQCKLLQPSTLTSSQSKWHGSASVISTPILFKPNSSFHGTQDLLAHFSSKFLNEGDCARHLSFLGFKLAFIEKIEDSLDFSIKNLATDLRDGVRLAKLVQMLINGKEHHHSASAGMISARRKPTGALTQPSVDIISQLRLPADSENKKLFNLNLVLSTLRNHSNPSSGLASQRSTTFSSSITAEELYAGNQVKTYNFIWELMLKYDVMSLISAKELGDEIVAIKQAYKNFKVDGLNGMDTNLLQQENLYFGPSEKVQTLLTWIQTVIWAHSLSELARGQPSAQLLIENFTTSFKSGVVPCLLLNYYYPSMLPMDAISLPTQRPDKVAWEVRCNDESKEEKEAADEDKENVNDTTSNKDGWSASFSCSSVFSQPFLEDQPDYLAARRNFRLVHACLLQLSADENGTPPHALPFTVESLFAHAASDVLSDIPNENAMIQFLSFLCSRVLILSKEIHAAKTLQKYGRAFLIKIRQKNLETAQQREESQRLKQEQLKEAALERKAKAQEEAALAAQHQSELAAKKATRQAEQAEKERVESETRAKAQQELRRQRLEQQRREMEAREQLEREAELQEAKLREMNELAAKMLEEKRRQELAAIQREKELTQVAVTFTKYFRAKLARRELDYLKAERDYQRAKAATKIQCAYRSFVARKKFSQLKQERNERIAEMRHKAAIKIQSLYLIMIAKQQLQNLRQLEQARRLRLKQEQSAVAIQCTFRCYRARIVFHQLRQDDLTRKQFEFARQQSAAITIQANYRMVLTRRLLESLKQQQAEQWRLQMLHMNAAALNIQCAYRSHLARQIHQQFILERNLLRQTRHHAAIKIQSLFRMIHAQCQSLRLKHEAEMKRIALATAATTIQCAYRCFVARQIFRQLQQERDELIFEIQTVAAINIQCAFRCHMARATFRQLIQERIQLIEEQQYQRAVAATIVIQSIGRRYLARQHFKVLKEMKRLELEAEEQRRQLAAQAQLEAHSAVTIQCAYRSHLARSLRSRLAQERAQRELQAEREALRQRQLVEQQAKAQKELERKAAQQAAEKILQELAAQKAEAELQLRRQKEEWAAQAALVAKRLKEQEAERATLLVKQSTAILPIQALVRGFLARRFVPRWRTAIVTLQKHWRGRLGRRLMSSKIAKRLETIGLKLKNARRTVTDENRVGNRTKSALEVLLSSKNLTTVLHATQTLDRTTGLLGLCCYDALKQNAIPALLEVTRSLNRSKPHVLLLESTLNILGNLAREKSTRSEVFQSPSLLDTCIDGMQSYAGSPTILLKLTKFLFLGIQCPNISLRTSLKQNVSQMKRLLGVQSLLERKLVLEKKEAANTAKRTFSSSTSSSSSATATATKSSKKIASSSSSSVSFDQFICPCHGVIASTVATSSVDKLHILIACCDHLKELVGAVQAD